MTIITLETLLQMIALFIFFLWWLYWRTTEKDAEQKKPKEEKAYAVFSRRNIMKSVLSLAQLVLVFQLLGYDLLPIQAAPPVLFTMQISGFLLVITGMLMAVAARKTLGDNWSHAAEYQVKQEQELVTTGIYAFIRHPIYSGLVIAYIGGQLLVQSYLVFVGILLFIGGYQQALLEEKLLIKHFGETYKQYMKRSKRFIPYLW